MPLTVAEFVIRWKAYDQSEEAGAKPLFFDLCDLLRQPHPAAADSAGENYASKSASAKPAEPRIRRRLVPRSLSLGIQEEAQAYTQLNDDREELGNPPLFVVCDFERFEVHTNYTRMSGMSSERTSVSTKRHEGHQAAEGWQSAVGRLRLRSSRLNL